MADLTPNNREEHWLQGMVDGQTTLEPNKRREYWYKEIVDAIGSGGGGGTDGGVLVVIADEPMASPPSWVTDIFDGHLIYETNVTYAQCHGAFVLGLSTPANRSIFYKNRSQMIAEFMDFGFDEELNTYMVYAQAYKYEGKFSQIKLQFIANAEDGMLYCAIENQN